MEEEVGEAAPPLLLTLFDLYWFHHQILLHDPPPPPPPPPPPSPPGGQEEVALHVAHLPPSVPRHRRSLSSEELNPSLRIRIDPQLPPKLQTILSGKEAAVSDDDVNTKELMNRRSQEEETGWRKLNKKKKKKKKKGSKSLSDLEFEELRGLIDLGFEFSDAETDPRLMSIVPALRRKGMAEGDVDPAAEAASPPALEDAAEAAVVSRRPYLSEAWDAEEEDPLRNWRIPMAAAGVDMKDHLKFWAHIVASTVR